MHGSRINASNISQRMCFTSISPPISPGWNDVMTSTFLFVGFPLFLRFVDSSSVITFMSMIYENKTRSDNAGNRKRPLFFASSVWIKYFKRRKMLSTCRVVNLTSGRLVGLSPDTTSFTFCSDLREQWFMSMPTCVRTTWGWLRPWHFPLELNIFLNFLFWTQIVNVTGKFLPSRTNAEIRNRCIIHKNDHTILFSFVKIKSIFYFFVPLILYNH